MIDTSPSSIRLFVILVLGIVWIWILNHPPKDNEL